ncbi:MAG: MFS family permease [Verrucomicrobiales bacterium]|jgi:MFS family permease
MTFAVLIAIEVYQTNDSVKALILASGPLGLIGSLFLVPLVLALRRAATRVASEISLVGALGFAIAAMSEGSLIIYIGGISLGLFSASVVIPLQTHWLRHNYPVESRGRLVGAGMAVRATASIIFSLGAGILLEFEIAGYPLVLAAFSIAGLVASVAMSQVPQPAMRPRERAGIFQAMVWIKRDKTFRWMLISMMVMGAAVLTTNALRVEYVANERYGLAFSETRVALLTSTIPALTRLGTTVFWGWLFDRINVIVMRLIMNGIFAIAIFLYFWGTQFWIIACGAFVFGIARGGGEILWNLWVTKLSPHDHVADYMSVHTFFTGIRGVVAPFLGFWAIASLGPRGTTMFALVCIVIAGLALVRFIPRSGNR